MLVKVTDVSMANSLEVRCPMLDHELAEFAARIPHSWKMRGGRESSFAMPWRVCPRSSYVSPKKGSALP